MSIIKNAIIGSEKEKKLPRTRLEQFFYLYKNNFLLLFYVSIISFVFLFPALFNFIISYVNYYNHLTQNEVINNSELFTIFFTAGIISIPCFIFLGIGSAGLYNVILNLIYEKGASIKDFFKGIKNNWLRFLIIYLIEGFLVFILLINYGGYYYLEIDAIIKLFSLIISIIFLVMFLLVKPFIIVQLHLFNNEKFQIIKNSFVLLISRIIKGIVYLALSSILYIGLIFLIDKVLIIDMVLLIMFQGSYSTMIASLFAINTIELNVDKKEYENIYHVGLEK